MRYSGRSSVASRKEERRDDSNEKEISVAKTKTSLSNEKIKSRSRWERDEPKLL